MTETHSRILGLLVNRESIRDLGGLLAHDHTMPRLCMC